ncbi:hypothetical protein LSCM1_05713 [Leishmania martiniquensis]|uniref:Uncharacterized protein n=1 Tax=Leishmania martiniquensis TaxID=1580590 RepID=A0A836KTB6_9TRYP|nr:hypothetical protein LSCM1_05713 [Leishmania martiniquensis]
MPPHPSTTAAVDLVGAPTALFEPRKQEPMLRHRPSSSTPDRCQGTSRADTNSPMAAPTLQSVGSSS